jgi:ribulose-bisphosphate carboxylase small chain
LAAAGSKCHHRGGATLEPTDGNADSQPLAERALGLIGHCLRKGCVICIEHTPRMAPGYSPWSIWGKPCCYNGDVQQIYSEIDRCRATHADHHIRLSIEDYSFRSRFSYVVHSSPAAGP